MRRGAEEVRPLSLEAHAFREGRAGNEGAALPIRFVREEADYRADLDTARFADHHGSIRVDARIEFAAGQFHDESLRLFLTPVGKIPARFTGEVEDRIENGSLRIEIGIDVEQSGEYRIDANLYDATGAPLAFSAYKGPLRRGQESVPIDFFGRLLIDLGRPGPYAVGEIRGYRFLDGKYPDRERIPDLPGRHPTRNFGLSSLSPAEFVSEDKLRMVRLLMEDVERGIAIDAPPDASAGLP